MEDERKTKKQLIEELNRLRLEKIEQERAKSEKFTIAFLQNTIPVSITTLKEGIFIDVSNAFLRLYGHKRDEVIGHTSLECGFITEEQRAVFYNKLNKKGYIEDLEMEVRTKGGALKYGLFNAIMMSINNENYLLTSIQDITGQKQAEENLKKSENMFATAFLKNSIPAAITTVKDGRYIEVSEEFLKLMGLEQSEVIGNTSTGIGFITPEQRQLVLNELGQKGSVVNLELQIRTKGGELRHGLFNSVKISLSGEDHLLTVVTDITDRKHAEEALRESENWYRTIFENTGTATVILDENTTITLANAEYEKLSGYTKKELEGKKSWTDFVVKEDLEKMIASHRQRRIDNNAAPKSYEFRFKDKKGHIKNIFLTIDMIPGTKRSVASLLDITELKQAEETLRESELKYRSLIENSSDVVFCVNENGEYQFTNNVFALTFGKTPDYFIGKTFWDVYTKEHADYWQAANKRVFETGVTQSSEKAVPLPDKILYFIAKANPIKDETGKVILNLTTATDITERKQTEQTLRDSEQKLQSIINAIPDGLAISSIEGSIQYVSPNTISMFGYASINELKGRNILEFVHPSDQTKAISLIGKMLNGNYTGAAEYLMLRKDGTEFFCEANAEIIRNTDGESTGIVYIIRDITDRKRAEENIRILADLSDISPLSITVHDLQGNFLYANQKTFEMHGYSKEEFLARKLHEIDVPASAALIEERMKIILETGEARFEVEHIRKDGTCFPMEVFVKAAQWGGKDVLLSVASDITERKSMERVQSEEHQKISSILDGSPVSSFVIDPNRRVTVWNMVNEFFTGISKKNVLGKTLNLSPLFNGKVRPTLAELVLELPDEEIIKRYADKGLRRSVIHPEAFETTGSIWIEGRERIMAIQATRIRAANGDVIGAIQCAHDITERRQAENERERLISELQKAISDIKKLSGLLPICSSCKKIRDDNGYWKQIESYIKENSEAQFSHGICPECAKKLYPDIYKKIYENKKD